MAQALVEYSRDLSKRLRRWEEKDIQGKRVCKQMSKVEAKQALAERLAAAASRHRSRKSRTAAPSPYPAPPPWTGRRSALKPVWHVVCEHSASHLCRLEYHSSRGPTPGHHIYNRGN